MAKKKIKKTKSKPTTTKKNNSKTSCNCAGTCKRPVNEYYNVETNEIYPKLFFRKDNLWTRIKRFLGFIP